GCPNTMPSSPQLNPNGFSDGQTVTAAPPLTVSRFSARSPTDQKASDWPSGEKAGLVMPLLPASLPAIAWASSVDIDRMYSRLFATYTRFDPSGDNATSCRPVFVNVWSSGSMTLNRVTLGGALGFSRHAPYPARAAPASSAAATGSAR